MRIENVKLTTAHKKKQIREMFVDSFARSGDVVFSYSRKAVNVTEMEMFRGKNKMQIVFELSRDVNY